MNVLLISDLCGSETYKTIIPQKYRMGQQSQKYLRLLCEGLAANGVEVMAISIPPVNTENNRNRCVYLPSENSHGITFNYIKITNILI